MPSVATQSFDASVRHQVLLEGLKAGEAKSLLKFLVEMERELTLRLAGDLTFFGRARAEMLIAEIGRLVESIATKYTTQLRADLIGVMVRASEFERNALNHAINTPLFESVLPAMAQIQAAVFSSPLSVRGPAGGKLLDAFLDTFTRAQVESVTGAIRRGVFEGQTNQQILNAIRGTRAGGYSDGLIAVSKRQGEAIVRTAVQHVANTARRQVMEANANVVKRVRWIATLDSRTSTICRSLDGQEWPLGEGPTPPAHINCRSTIVPVIDDRFQFDDGIGARASQDGPVRGDLTYYDWLKRQPASFQNQVLGKTRAQLLRNGGLSAERFARLNLSRDFKPLTLDEMKRLEPLAFERAGIKP